MDSLNGVELPLFESSTHTYRIKDKVTPSVTQVLRNAGLICTEFYSEKAMRRGTDVHLAIYHLAGNRAVEVREDIIPYIDAYQKFIKASGARVRLCEQIVYSTTYDYAGTFDWYGELNGNMVLIDLKTGGDPSYSGMQLAAYLDAGVECGLMKANTKRFVLQLKSTGAFSLIPKTDRSDLQTFRNAIQRTREYELNCLKLLESIRGQHDCRKDGDGVDGNGGNHHGY